MRLLLMLISVSILFQTTFLVEASSALPVKIENINLNINDREVAVTFLGLSTGEATLIQGPNAKNILVNAGGKETISELNGWLSLYKVKEISTLVLTHDGPELSPKQINQLILKYNIKEIITTPEVSASLTKNLDLTGEISVISWREGTKKMILPELTLEAQFVGNEQNEGMDLTLQFFKHRIFLMTSFSPRAEQRLLTKSLENINVFKVPTSKKIDSLSDELMHSVNPQISILFTADHHHPDPDILHGLHDTWSEVYFTKIHGSVTIKFTETNYEVVTIPVEADE